MVQQMRITEAAKQTGATTDQIRYLERKGFVRSRWVQPKQRRVRDYSADDLIRIQMIIKHLDQGFRLDVAYQRALDEIQRPPLI